MYTNAGIYRTKEISTSVDMVMVLSAFADDETILVMPLYLKTPTIGIPILVGTALMYIGAYDAFRIKKNELTTAIATLDVAGIEMVAKGMYSAVYGELQRVSIPTAIMEPDFQFKNSFNEEPNTTLAEKSNSKQRYSSEDYEYIMANYQTNVSEILLRYELKDKRSVYRLKHYLQKRYGNDTKEKEVNEPEGER